MEGFTTVLAVIFWLAVIAGLATINPVLAFFPALYLMRYMN